VVTDVGEVGNMILLCAKSRRAANRGLPRLAPPFEMSRHENGIGIEIVVEAPQVVITTR
jgi:hypothetical protein